MMQARLSVATTAGVSSRTRDAIVEVLRAADVALAAAEARLADPSFTGKAPAAVVAGAERRVAELRDEIARLERGS